MPPKINTNEHKNTQAKAKPNKTSDNNPLNNKIRRKTQLEQKQDNVLNRMNVLLNNRLIEVFKTNTLTLEIAKEIKKDIIKDFPVQNRHEIHAIHNFSNTLDEQLKTQDSNKMINQKDKTEYAQAIKTTLKDTGFSGFTHKIFTAKPQTIENMELLNDANISQKFKNISIKSDDSKGSISITSDNSKIAFDFLNDFEVQSINSIKTNSSGQSDSSSSFVKI